MFKIFKMFSIFCLATTWLFPGKASDVPKLPIGMNLDGNSYWTKSLIFNDVIKTGSKWISFNANGSSPWDAKLAASIDYDSSGWPLHIPFTPPGEAPQKVRFLINNYYKGDFVLLFDGRGRISINGGVNHEKVDDNTYNVELTGEGGHVWIDVHESIDGDHIRNMRLIPKQWRRNEDNMPVFNERYLEGLRPFQVIRFMNWMKINGSEQKQWSDRVLPWTYSQALKNGVAIEYAIMLCNQLGADAWFCVPHQADDDYITRFAELVRDSLDPSLKVYVEYSNEVWNWSFAQSHYVLDNAPGHNNRYVIDNLKAINPAKADHPEKDAFMMQRTFRLWSQAFAGQPQRLVRVAAGQHAWADNSRRILKYLFKTNRNGAPVSGGAYETSSGAGCDAFAVGGYFNFRKEHHEAWNSMNPADVTAEMILDSVFTVFDETTGAWSEQTARYVKAWDVDYLVYEGGQHIQPWRQGEWGYNQAVWDAQIHPRMYDLYMKNFTLHASEKVNCTLFMAFSYISERESRWGSWGHLESMEQIGAADYMTTAPKYQALLDVNSEFPAGIGDKARPPLEFRLRNYPNPFNAETKITFSLPHAGPVALTVYNLVGRQSMVLLHGMRSAGRHEVVFRADELPSGLYFYNLVFGDRSITGKCMLLK